MEQQEALGGNPVSGRQSEESVGSVGKLKWEGKFGGDPREKHDWLW